jgi:hypothetical protein
MPKAHRKPRNLDKKSEKLPIFQFLRQKDALGQTENLEFADVS